MRLGIGVRQRNIHMHVSNLRDKFLQVNHNRGIKLTGVLGWCQMTLFFTCCPPHALHAAQINNLEMREPNIFTIMF